MSRNRDRFYDKKQWLLRYSEHINEIEREIESEQYWIDRAQALSTRPLSHTGFISSHVKHSDVEQCVLQYLEIAEHCRELAVKASKAKDEIILAIDQLKSHNQREILKMRYIDGLEFDEIANRTNYTLDWVYKEHVNALKDLKIENSPKKS